MSEPRPYGDVVSRNAERWAISCSALFDRAWSERAPVLLPKKRDDVVRVHSRPSCCCQMQLLLWPAEIAETELPRITHSSCCLRTMGLAPVLRRTNSTTADGCRASTFGMS